MQINNGVIEYLTIGFTLDFTTLDGKKFRQKHLPPIFFQKVNSNIKICSDMLNDYFLSFKGQKVCVLMSGGKDSRLILEFCKKYNLDTTAVTLGFNEDNVENKVAKKICTFLKVNHKFLSVEGCVKETFDYIKRFDPTCRPNFNFVLYKDFFRDFDVVFSGEFLTISLREENFYQPKQPIDRLLRTLRFSKIIKKEFRDEIKRKIVTINRDKTLEEICLWKLLNAKYKWMDRIKDLFNFTSPGLDNEILNYMWSIKEKDNVKKIARINKFKTFNIRCTRSFFPLFFPWYIHYGYHTTKNIKYFNKVGMANISNFNMGPWLGHTDKFYEDLKQMTGNIEPISRYMDIKELNKASEKELIRLELAKPYLV